jgi:predicted nucleic acid-binding protein
LNALDKGEKHTLAIQKNADHVIIDEKIARNVAMGLSVTGTLGVLLKAKQ